MFLGVDQRPSLKREPPLLFETNASDFSEDFGVTTGEYATWEQAEAGHRGAVLQVRERSL